MTRSTLNLRGTHPSTSEQSRKGRSTSTFNKPSTPSLWKIHHSQCLLNESPISYLLHFFHIIIQTKPCLPFIPSIFLTSSCKRSISSLPSYFKLKQPGKDQEVKKNLKHQSQKLRNSFTNKRAKKDRPEFSHEILSGFLGTKVIMC